MVIAKRASAERQGEAGDARTERKELRMRWSRVQSWLRSCTGWGRWIPRGSSGYRRNGATGMHPVYPARFTVCSPDALESLPDCCSGCCSGCCPVAVRIPTHSPAGSPARSPARVACRGRAGFRSTRTQERSSRRLRRRGSMPCCPWPCPACGATGCGFCWEQAASAPESPGGRGRMARARRQGVSRKLPDRDTGAGRDRARSQRAGKTKPGKQKPANETRQTKTLRMEDRKTEEWETENRKTNDWRRSLEAESGDGAWQAAVRQPASGQSRFASQPVRFASQVRQSGLPVRIASQDCQVAVHSFAVRQSGDWQ
jgi:hypothetical protein